MRLKRVKKRVFYYHKRTHGRHAGKDVNMMSSNIRHIFKIMARFKICTRGICCHHLAWQGHSNRHKIRFMTSFLTPVGKESAAYATRNFVGNYSSLLFWVRASGIAKPNKCSFSSVPSSRHQRDHSEQHFLQILFLNCFSKPTDLGLESYSWCP